MKLIHTTVRTALQAREISGALLKAGAGCVSYWKISSAYFWKGKEVKETEYAVEIKCAGGRAEKLAHRLERIHPYKIPMVLIIDAGKANAAYERWLGK